MKMERTVYDNRCYRYDIENHNHDFIKWNILWFCYFFVINSETGFPPCCRKHSRTHQKSLHILIWFALDFSQNTTLIILLILTKISIGNVTYFSSNIPQFHTSKYFGIPQDFLQNIRGNPSSYYRRLNPHSADDWTEVHNQ